jgi:hypothetical protein
VVTQYASVHSVPETGRSAIFNVMSGPLNGTGIMVQGNSNTANGWWRLPMAHWTAPGCTVYTNQIASYPVFTTWIGVGGIAIQIPNDPLLVGTKFYTQFYMDFPFVNQAGVALSNAMETLIGGVQ